MGTGQAASVQRMESLRRSYRQMIQDHSGLSHIGQESAASVQLDPGDPVPPHIFSSVGDMLGEISRLRRDKVRLMDSLRAANHGVHSLRKEVLTIKNSLHDDRELASEYIRVLAANESLRTQIEQWEEAQQQMNSEKMHVGDGSTADPAAQPPHHQNPAVSWKLEAHRQQRENEALLARLARMAEKMVELEEKLQHSAVVADANVSLAAELHRQETVVERFQQNQAQLLDELAEHKGSLSRVWEELVSVHRERCRLRGDLHHASQASSKLERQIGELEALRERDALELAQMAGALDGRR